MFTGIIEQLGQIQSIVSEGQNLRFRISAPMTSELKVDQSVNHNGVCLTVVDVNPSANWYEVVAVHETLQKSNLGAAKVGDWLNLERAMLINSRLDGHFVQGHVDGLGQVLELVDEAGSWRICFAYPEINATLLVEKGSIAINGVSLTVIAPTNSTFSVAIIPYTWNHTNIRYLKVGASVNLEFDILGKYIQRYLALK